MNHLHQTDEITIEFWMIRLHFFDYRGCVFGSFQFKQSSKSGNLQLYLNYYEF